MEVYGRCHIPTAASSGKETRYPFYGGLGGCQERSGRQQKTSPTQGSDPQTVKAVANRIHRLNYPSLKAMCKISMSTRRKTTNKAEKNTEQIDIHYLTDIWKRRHLTLICIFISVFNQLDAQNLFHNKFNLMPLHEIKLIVKQILCVKLVKYWDKYTKMHGQQNVKINMYIVKNHTHTHTYLHTRIRMYMPISDPTTNI
jgi:hypothetical protein